MNGIGSSFLQKAITVLLFITPIDLTLLGSTKFSCNQQEEINMSTSSLHHFRRWQSKSKEKWKMEYIPGLYQRVEKVLEHEGNGDINYCRSRNNPKEYG